MRSSWFYGNDVTMPEDEDEQEVSHFSRSPRILADYSRKLLDIGNLASEHRHCTKRQPIDYLPLLQILDRTTAIRADSHV